MQSKEDQINNIQQHVAAKVVAHLRLQSTLERKLQVYANFAYDLLDIGGEQHPICGQCLLPYAEPSPCQAPCDASGCTTAMACGQFDCTTDTVPVCGICQRAMCRIHLKACIRCNKQCCLECIESRFVDAPEFHCCS